MKTYKAIIELLKTNKQLPLVGEARKPKVRHKLIKKGYTVQIIRGCYIIYAK